MFYKLAENCVQFETMGIPMLGNPVTGHLFGLDDEGKLLSDKLISGCNIEEADLSDSQKALFNALRESNLFCSGKAYDDGNRAAYFHVTSRCNMNCTGCYSQLDGSYAGKEPLSLKDIRGIIDNMAEAKVKSVIISGGEPFLRADILEVMKYMKEKIPAVGCISNGYADIDTYLKAGEIINGISFSLDGPSEEASYLRKKMHSKIIDIIVRMKEKGQKPRIVFTLHKRNYRDYFEMQHLAETLGVSYNFSLFQAPHSPETEEYEVGNEMIEFLCSDKVVDSDIKLEDSAGSGSFGCRECCGAGRTMISIASNGDIFPCHMFYDSRFLMGNALRDNLNEFFEKHRDPLVHLSEKEECKNCEYRYLCGGGCAFRGYVNTGSVQGLDPLCPMHIAYIRKTIKSLVG